MRSIIFSVFSFLLLFGTRINAQTAEDSLTIMNIQWETTKTSEGIIHKRAHVEDLYEGCQHINLIEIPRKRKFHFGIGSPGNMKPTSIIAKQNNALAAINGSYYNMRKGNSVCFLKTDAHVIDSTAASEFELRVTGAVCTNKHKIDIIPWNAQTERNYQGDKGTVLASGPLLISDGAACSWNDCETSFIHTKHPRSALFLTKKSVVFLTADGRSKGNAIGVNIPELAHLIRMLGGKDAINLDGGGSTTLWIGNGSEGQILNCPSDNRKFDHEGERSVSNAIFVKSKGGR